MNPLETTLREKSAVLECQHGDIWPPVHVSLDEPIEAQRASGLIDDHKYEQIRTWERVCGLKEMSESKCPGCPLARVHDKKLGLRPLNQHEKPRRGSPHYQEPTKQAPPFAQARKGRGNGGG